MKAKKEAPAQARPPVEPNETREDNSAQIQALTARVEALEAAARGDAPYRAPVVEPDADARDKS